MRLSKWTVLACLAMFLLAGACAKKEANEIRLGVNAELTGSKPAVGASCKNAAELLAAQVNQAGGVKLGDQAYKVSLFVEDNEDKAESAAAAAQKLITQNNVLAIIGPNASGNAIPAARICEDAKVIMVSPWSTFATTAGTLSKTAAITNAEGKAESILTCNRSQTAEVTIQCLGAVVKGKLSFTSLGAGNVSKMGRLVDNPEPDLHCWHFLL